ncbi:MAG: zf-HC2 domain-containing protein [Actinomycetota bacterium]
MTDDSDFIRNELRITCADAVELVTDYLDAALSESDRDDFETHLSLCEGCQVFVDQVRRTITLTSNSRDTTVELEPANMSDLLAALGERAGEHDHDAG